MGRERNYAVDESQFLDTNEEKKRRTNSRKKNGIWPSTAIISAEGMRLLEQDLDVSDATLNRLIVTDRFLIDSELMQRICRMSNRELAEEVFGAYDEIGLAHLALCIAENPQQTMAQLIIQYSDDRRIPVALGAMYINAYLKSGGRFFYYKGTLDSRVKVEWMPVLAKDVPKNTMPPKKQKGESQPIVAAKSKMNDLGVKLSPCPHCGRQVSVVLFDRDNGLFAATCSNNSCELSSGLRPLAPFQKAIDMYEEYHGSFIDDPPIVNPGEYVAIPKKRKSTGSRKKATRIRTNVSEEETAGTPVASDTVANEAVNKVSKEAETISDEDVADVTLDDSLAAESVSPSMPPAKKAVKTRKSTTAE